MTTPVYDACKIAFEKKYQGIKENKNVAVAVHNAIAKGQLVEGNGLSWMQNAIVDAVQREEITPELRRIADYIQSTMDIVELQRKDVI